MGDKAVYYLLRPLTHRGKCCEFKSIYKIRQPYDCLIKERKTRLELATPTLARSCSTN